MRIKHFFPAVAVVLLAACGENINTSKDLKTSEDSFSYIYGYGIAQRMSQEGIDELDYGAFIRGIRDGLSGKDSTMAIKEDKMGKIYQGYIMSNQEKKTKKLQKETQEYLAKIAKEPGVQSLPSKGYMKMITKGNGPVPQAWDSVECYVKWSTGSGNVIIDSYKDKKPFIGIISGLQLTPVEQAMQKAPAGSVFEVTFSNNDYPQLSRMFRNFNDAYGVSVWKVELRKVTRGTPTSVDGELPMEMPSK